MDKTSAPQFKHRIWVLSVAAFVASGGPAVRAMQRGQIGATPGNSPGVIVSGKVVTAPGTPLPNSVGVTMQSPQTGILSSEMQPDGTFEFRNVQPGSYLLRAAAPQFQAQSTITVATSNLTGIELTDSSWIRHKTGLQQVWSLNGVYSGIVWDASAGVLHAKSGRTLADIDPDGKIVNLIAFRTFLGANLRLAHFTGVGPVLLAFGTWSRNVAAFDLSGKELWSYGEDIGGIDDVWPAHLDGSGSDNVIVGFNGKPGLHVLDSNGHLIWKNASIANVWHVAGADLDGTGKLQAISTAADGNVHVFADGGNTSQDLRAGFFAQMIRAGKISRGATDTIFVIGGGSGSAGPTAAALSMDGTRIWTVQLPGSKPVYSTYLAAAKPWLAVGRQGGEVDVIDAFSGAIIGTIDGQGFDPEPAWIESKNGGEPLLAISTPSGLAAFKVGP